MLPDIKAPVVYSTCRLQDKLLLFSGEAPEKIMNRSPFVTIYAKKSASSLMVTHLTITYMTRQLPSKPTTNTTE